MAIIEIESRRTFLRGLFGTAAGGAAAAALSACQVAVDGPSFGASYQTGVLAPAEIVPLRPGVRYADTMPASIPYVRTLRFGTNETGQGANSAPSSIKS